MKQVRKIKPTYRSISGHFAFMGESIAYESTLERDFLRYQTFRKEVIDIVPQPVSIPFKKNGRTHSYTPDYFVQLSEDHGKSVIVEVKPKLEWQENWRDWSDKWKAAIKYSKDQGFRFAIYDEDRIHHLAFHNINFLRKYKNLYAAPEEVKAVLADLELRDNTTVEYILERYFKGDIYRPRGCQFIWYLMANKLIGFDVWNDIRSEKVEIWHAE